MSPSERDWINITYKAYNLRFNRFKNLGELHKEWTEAGVKAKEKKNWTVVQWSKVLFSDESKFCISFGNQGNRVWRKGGEAHSPSCLKSSVNFPQSVMICGAMSSAGVGPLCPSAHTPGAVGSRPCSTRGAVWGFGALLKGLTSVVDNSCQSRDSNPQPRVTSPTLYPLGHGCPTNWSPPCHAELRQ